MKKLGKLSINPDRVMKNEELVNLRGGYSGYGDTCPSGTQVYTCSCTGTAGLWAGCYSSSCDAMDSVRIYCINGSGGRCITQY